MLMDSVGKGMDMKRRMATLLVSVALMLGLTVPAHAGWTVYQGSVPVPGPCQSYWSLGYLHNTQWSGSIYQTSTSGTWSRYTQTQYRVKEWRTYRGCYNYHLIDRYYQYHQTRWRTCWRFRGSVACTGWTSWS